MGHGGPEERANKQVAEGGRGETLIPCCARQATHNSNENPCSSFAEERFKYSHTGWATRRIKKHLPNTERVQAILLSKQLFFDVAFFTERRKNTPHCTECCGSGKHGCPFPPYYISLSSFILAPIPTIETPQMSHLCFF